MQFKSEITTGTILTIITMAAGGFGVWSNTQAKIAHMESEIHALKDADKEIKAASLKTEADIIKRLDEIKADVKEMSKVINKR